MTASTGYAVADITELKAIDNTIRTTGYVRSVTSEKSFFVFIESSSDTADDVNIIQPTTGSGRWYKFKSFVVASDVYNLNEFIDDRTAALLTSAGTLSFSYNDSLNTLTLDVSSGSLTDTHINASAAIAQSKISGLVSALAGKASTSHTHTSSNITDFDNAAIAALSIGLVAGTGINVSYNGTSHEITLSYAGSGSSSVDVFDEGSSVGAATELDFVGGGVDVTYAGSRATINIAGGSSSSSFTFNNITSSSDLNLSTNNVYSIQLTTSATTKNVYLPLNSSLSAGDIIYLSVLKGKVYMYPNASDSYFGYNGLSVTRLTLDNNFQTICFTYTGSTFGWVPLGGSSSTITYIKYISSTTLADGAAAAYSLRRIGTGITNAIRVRRTSDNVEQNIGFSSDELDVSALTSFIGSSSGRIVTWYDQSGNSRDLTNGTTSQQPIIISSGTMYTLGTNGKPSIYFNGSSYWAYSPDFTSYTNGTYCLLMYHQMLSNQMIASKNTAANSNYPAPYDLYGGAWYAGSSSTFLGASGYSDSSYSDTTNDYVRCYSITNSTWKAYKNSDTPFFTSGSSGTLPSTEPTSSICLGRRRDGGVEAETKISEYIYYGGTDITTDMTGYMNNLNTYYGIY